MSDQYRLSHTADATGVDYDLAYAPDTFYGQLWATIERPLLERELSSLRADGAASCLDFACGTGRILESVSGVFDDVVGVDVSGSMIAQARARALAAEIVQLDITEESLGRSFDVATAFRFFRNAEPTLREAAVRGLKSHLKPGGVLVVNTHGNPLSPSMIALRAKSFVTSTPARTLSTVQLCNLLTSYGFIIESTTNYSYLPRFGGFFPGWYSRLLSPVERVGSKIPFVRNMSESTVVVARLAR